jgi:hypothetical protein
LRCRVDLKRADPVRTAATMPGAIARRLGDSHPGQDDPDHGDGNAAIEG